MRVYLKGRNGYNGIGEYNVETKELTLLSGSIVSNSISHSGRFNKNKKIEYLRTKYVNNNVVHTNIKFKSASAAANFVTGTSTNGRKKWKNEQGISLNELK